MQGGDPAVKSQTQIQRTNSFKSIAMAIAR